VRHSNFVAPETGPPYFGCSDGAAGEYSSLRTGCLVVHQRRNRARPQGVLWAGQRFAAAIAGPRRAIGQASIDLARQFVRARFYLRDSGCEFALPFRVLISSAKRIAVSASRLPRALAHNVHHLAHPIGKCAKYFADGIRREWLPGPDSNQRPTG
jgi:hypothetical protein